MSKLIKFVVIGAVLIFGVGFLNAILNPETPEQTAARHAADAAATAAAAVTAADDHFDAAQPGALVGWVKKYHAVENDADASTIRPHIQIAFQDGELSVQQDSKIDRHEIFEASSLAFYLLKDYKKAASNPGELRTILYTVREELFDKYHNSIGYQPVMKLRFDATEAMKYNPESITRSDIVDTARLVFLHPAFRDAPKAYCDGEWYPPKIFCARVAATGE